MKNLSNLWQSRKKTSVSKSRRKRFAADYLNRACAEPLERRIFLDGAVINVGTTIASSGLSNFGANIQDPQLNNMTNDPGFEPTVLRLQGTATGGGSNYIVNNQGPTTTDYGAISDHFFDGATVLVYRTINNVVTLIRTDTVTTYLASAASGYQIDLASNGPAIQAGDLYDLELTTDNAPTNDVGPGHTLAQNNDTWYWLGTGDAFRDSSTVAPVNGGDTSMEMVNTGSGQFSIQQFYFGAIGTGYQQLVPGTTYRVDVWLKQQGLASGNVTFMMDGDYSAVNNTFTGVTNNWQEFTYDFVAPAYPTDSAIIQSILAFTGPGTVWADNLLIYNPSYAPFAVMPQAVQALEQYAPGTLRIWSGQTNTGFGTTMENWTDPDSLNDVQWDPNYGKTTEPGLHLPNALALAAQVGANPWLIVGPYMNTQEWQDLFEYLAGPAGTPYGDKRISQGQTDPWTDDFSAIYIEFGNETWNSLFQPWTFSSGAQYGEFAQYFFQAAKASPYYAAIASKIHFVLGGWDIQSDVSGYGAQAMLACPDADTLAISGYIGNVSSGISDAGFQSQLVAEPDYMYSFADATIATQQTLASQGRTYQLAVYESGPSYDLPDPGSPYNAVEEQYGKSLAAAVGVLDSALYREYVGFVADNYFLFQPGNNWASNSTAATGYIPYPDWLALQMRNNYASGDMLTTTDLQMPTVEFNGTAEPSIGAYAFQNGDNYSVIVLNRDLDNANNVTLDLPFSSAAGGVTLHTLTGDPRANNLTAENISIASQNVSSFSQDFSFTIPAGSIYVYDFSDTTTTAPTPPPAPTGLSATPGNGSVTLNWNGAFGATSYNVKYSTTSGGPYTVINNVTTNTQAITGLTNGTPYYFTVSAVNGIGEGQNATEISSTPVLAAPLAPSSLNATAGDGQVALTWNPVASASSYNVKYSSTSGGPYTVISGITTTGATVTGLTDGTPYYFVVSASNTGGESVNSTQISSTPTTTPVTTTTLNFPGGFGSASGSLAFNGSAKIDSGGALSLIDGSGSEAGSAYALAQQNITGFTTQFDFQINGQWPLGDGFTFVIQNAGLNALGGIGGGLGYMGINNSIAIKFDVYDNSGEGDNSTGLYTDGAAPTNINSIDLGSTGFNMRSYDLSSATLTYDGTTLTVTLKDLTTGATATQQYAVNIPAIVGGSNAYVGFTAADGALTSVDRITNWTFSSTGSSPTLPAAPSAPAGLNANPGDGQIALSWSPTANANSYNLKYSATSGGPYTTITGITNTSQTVTGLTDGTPYFFVVSASNSGGEGPNSSEISATPVAAGPTLPAAPATLTATPGDGLVTLNWSTVANANSYNVKYSSTTGGPYTVIPGVTGTSQIISGLTDGTPYYFLVSSVNTAGEGSNSTQISSTPAAAATNTINFPDFSSAASSMTVNGTGKIANGALALTASSTYEDTSAYFNTQQNISSFTTQFDFQLTGNWPIGDGFTFVIQRAGINALGANGGGLGYQGIGNSVAIKFDLFDNSGEGNNSTGLFENGAAPTNVGSVDLDSTGFNLRSYDRSRALISYDGTTLTVTLTDLVTGASATQTYTVNIPAVIGGANAWVGFTGSDGHMNSNQNIYNWSFAPGSAPAPTPPATPTGLSPTAGNGQVTLNWNPVSGASSYNVKYAATSGGPYTTLTGFTTNSATISPLANGTPYFFVVDAVNSAGPSGDSTEVSATPTAPAPTSLPAPLGLTASAADGQVTLKWNAVAGATSYNVEYGTATGVYTQSIIGISSGLTTTISGLSDGQPYYFVVTAVNSTSQSDPSSEVSATPTATPSSNINFSSGFSGAAGKLNLNGAAAISNNTLLLTNGANNQASSAYSLTPQNVAAFSTNFNFQITGNWPIADGMTFTIQNAAANALGVNGGGLGYMGINNSVAVKFDIFDNAGEGDNSTGLYLNGAAPTNANSIDLDGTGVNLRSYDLMNASITYDGTTLTVTITDTVTRASATQHYAVNIPAVIGGSTAYVGFTAGDGALTSVQQITNWTFSS